MRFKELRPVLKQLEEDLLYSALRYSKSIVFAEEQLYPSPVQPVDLLVKEMGYQPRRAESDRALLVCGVDIDYIKEQIASKNGDSDDNTPVLRELANRILQRFDEYEIDYITVAYDYDQEDSVLLIVLKH